MTDKEIAELRRSFGRGDPTLGQCVAVLHVLEEREALLHVCKVAVLVLGDAGMPIVQASMAGMCAELQEAIDTAEEERKVLT